ncbi:hypothetical protein [Desulfopila sp. IMCC35008]|uniref:hypothetical protein n=1 Tax=Desulfopila sp. IMCC35008 TaxID=2653858 RepID=UPI0013D5187F|nr:hypothetical protein [Desulfopila sp. IMCC35008]
MSRQLKTTLLVIMSIALGCGFMHHLIPTEEMNFERLHIFLFNLCSGGTLLIYFTEDRKRLSKKGRLFFLLSICFALFSFLEWYVPTLIIPLFLATITEKVRIDHFGSIVPRDLFNIRESVSRKFHQASLLCLSMSLILSSPVILNSVYTHWFYLEKLKLDTFFLGFSFPLSLISMSVIYSLMQKHEMEFTVHIKETLFWTINLGVIVFFVFILARWFVPQVMIATTLFLAVALTLYLYYHQGIQVQQKAFLTSGILFLLITSITGIIYILVAFSDSYDPQRQLPLLRLHAFTALYGWNLSGLAVISRHGDFPLRLHSKKTIILHWFTVLVLCPAGYFYAPSAVLAVIFYIWLLHTLLFNYGPIDLRLVSAEDKVLKTE